MKILHSADWHLGAYVGPQCDDPMKRMENTMECLNVLIRKAKEEQPDVILIAGDVFHTAKVWSDRANVELRIAAVYINFLQRIAPTVVLYGTPNHDNPEQFQTLRKLTDAFFICEPKIETIQTVSGPIQVAGIPGFNKGTFRAQFPGLSDEEENRMFTEQLDSIVQGLSAQVDPTIPSILMAHHTVIGCELDNGQHVFQQNDVVLSAATLENSAFNMVCLGHIHRGQCVGDPIRKPIFYSGSIDASNFNEEEHIKGFWIHDTDHPINPKFIETPARQFYTVKPDDEMLKDIITNGLFFNDQDAPGTSDITGKVIRVLYSCDKATEKALDKKKLDRDLYAAGAYYVSEIRPEKVKTEVNKEKMHEKLTVWDCLRNYLREKFKGNSFASILTEAEPIVSEVEASSVAGTQTGMFLPIEIEVRNYRSYSNEKLSFEDLFFAMINGKNGSGKSSLVMDAVVDCLYEEPREGEKTGWIKSGEKSGSISFTFQIGADSYRVTRTRQRSGKATLSISKLGSLGAGISYNPEFPLNWQDISCQKIVDTQVKIIQLLGMDANTFRSCVLIMQDQCSRFMEAESKDRMLVLANLLGLGIYKKLEEITKKLLSNINRELKQAKDEVAGIEQEVSNLEAYQSMKKDTEKKLQTEQAALTLLKQDQAVMTEKVTLLNANKAKLMETQSEVLKKESAILEASKKLDNLSTNIADTKEFLKNESLYYEKYNKFLNIRTQMAGMDGTVRLVEDKKKSLASLLHEGYLAEQNIKKYRHECDEIFARLEMGKGLETELLQLSGIEAELKLQDEMKTSANELAQKILIVTSSLKNIDNSIQSNERQAAILKDSNCIDINRAQCGFLRAAKEAEAKLAELQQSKIAIISELNQLEGERALSYNTEVHAEIKAKAERAQRIKNQLATLEGERKSGEMYMKQIAELEMKALQLTCQIADIQNEIAELTPQIKALCELQAEEAELGQYESIQQDITKAKAYLDAVSPQIDDLEKVLSDLESEKKELLDRQMLVHFDISNNIKYVESLRVITTEIQRFESNIAGYNRSVGSLEEKIHVLVDKAVELNKRRVEIQMLAEKASRLQVLSEAFSQDGIPHQIVRDIVPDLEEAANEILSQMTGGRMSLEFKTEKTRKSNEDVEVPILEIEVTTMDNGKIFFKGLSGGQMTRCSLSVIFALAILKASRTGMQLGMLFIDEPKGLDEEGIDGYCTALETIHNLYPDMRIVAISHDERMKARFAQHLFVEITENGSKVRKG